jgi:hypothetical protein
MYKIVFYFNCIEGLMRVDKIIIIIINMKRGNIN